MTNPIELITHPLNKISIDFSLQIYVIKVENRSVLGLYKPTSSEATVSYCSSSLVNLTNPFITWNDQVYEKGRQMTKQEFMDYDFNTEDAFSRFKFFKDPYDGIKLVPVSKTFSNPVRKNETLAVDGIEVRYSYTEKIDQIVYDLSTKVNLEVTKHLEEAGDLRDSLLREICAETGKIKLQRNYLCVFEIETLADENLLAFNEQLHEFQKEKDGNFVTIPLRNATAMGMYMENPEDAPLSPTNHTSLRLYLDNLMEIFIAEMNKVSHEYFTRITANFGVALT